MLVSCWSCKGGSGTTVVSVALASSLARSAGGALLVDLTGDVPSVLGMPDVDTPGVGEWLAAGAGVPADALARLEVAGPAGVRVLVRGAVDGGEERAGVLAALLAAEQRPVVVDGGTDPSGVALAVTQAASSSLLVVRPCFLALRRAQRSVLRPTGVVVVREPGRVLRAADVEAAVGAPVVAEVPVDEAVARAVDAGTLAHRVPRSLHKALRRVA